MATDTPHKSSLPLGEQIHRIAAALASSRALPSSSVPYLWLTLFFVVPCLIVLKISFAQTLIAQPPYTPMFGPDSVPHDQLFDNFKRLFGDLLYIKAYRQLAAAGGRSRRCCAC